MIVEYPLLAVAGLLSVPSLVCGTQVLLALPARPGRDLDDIPRLRVGILMPAHNEASVIAGSVRALMPQLLAGDRLLVIADNCSDDTATVAARVGAEVAVRCDPDRRGKGYALDFGLTRMAQDPPDIVVVIDADCAVDAACIDRLARLCAVSSRPVQALYLMRSPPQAGAGIKLAEFAWVVKNWVRPSGFCRIGLPCQLMGTGMAFPWGLTQYMQLANANIVEDMQLGVDLAVSGHPAMFCPEARVFSDFPVDHRAARTQRTRWEHGHLSMILSGVPRLLAAAVSNRDIRLLGLALDLAVPPLALLVLLASAVSASGFVAWLLGASWGLLGLAALPLGIMLASISLAWFGWGRQLLSFRTLLRVPLYIAAKIQLYLQFLFKRQTSWVKTKRD